MTITLHVMSELKAVWKWMQITPIIDTDRANTHFSHPCGAEVLMRPITINCTHKVLTHMSAGGGGGDPFCTIHEIQARRGKNQDFLKTFLN